jgi:hypothetical protein
MSDLDTVTADIHLEEDFPVRALWQQRKPLPPHALLLASNWAKNNDEARKQKLREKEQSRLRNKHISLPILRSAPDDTTS